MARMARVAGKIFATLVILAVLASTVRFRRMAPALLNTPPYDLSAPEGEEKRFQTWLCSLPYRLLRKGRIRIWGSNPGKYVRASNGSQSRIGLHCAQTRSNQK